MAKLPPKVEERLQRGRHAKAEHSALWKECLEFWRGNQYIYRYDKTKLGALSTTVSSGPGHCRRPATR